MYIDVTLCHPLTKRETFPFELLHSLEKAVRDVLYRIGLDGIFLLSYCLKEKISTVLFILSEMRELLSKVYKLFSVSWQLFLNAFH